MESAPPFEETSIESLGDFAGYRRAIEEADLRDREVWSGVAQMWYNRAADKRLETGSISPPLAVLTRLDSELLGLVPEGFNDNDSELEAGNKSVRDQRLDPGEPQPLPEDFLLTGQVYASY